MECTGCTLCQGSSIEGWHSILRSTDFEVRCRTCRVPPLSLRCHHNECLEREKEGGGGIPSQSDIAWRKMEGVGLCGTDIGELLAHCMNDKNKMVHSLDSQSDRSPVNKSEKYLDGGEPLICRNTVNFVKNKKRACAMPS